MGDIGCPVVDCPISGGPAGVAAGTLSVMVSGDPAAVAILFLASDEASYITGVTLPVGG
jgi:3-hydroxyisobutyrate dehydrogenase-like beta-hydroxyacid dehydrogenase